MWIYVCIILILSFLLIKLKNFFIKINYQGKTIWITGASSGIGEFLSYEFARHGGHVLLSGRNLKELQRVHEKIPTSSTIIPLDLSNAEVLFKEASKICENYKIDVLVNNAGISQRGLFEENLMNVDIERKLMEVNYFSSIALTKVVVENMLGRGGHIIIITSVAGIHGANSRTGYSASKAAMIGYFESLRAELKDHNISLTTLSPGFVNTNVSINALTSKGEVYGEVDPLNKGGFEPDEFAKRAVKRIFLKESDIIISQFYTYILIAIMSFSLDLTTRIIRFLTKKMSMLKAQMKKKD